MRLLEGVYVTMLDARPDLATSNPQKIVGSGATIAAPFGLVGHFDIRGINLVSTLECDGSRASTFTPTLDLHDAVTAAGSNTELEQGCSGHFDRVDIQSTLFVSGSETKPGTFVGDRLHFSGPANLQLTGFGLDFTLTNSVLADTTMALASFDMTPASTYRFAFNTIVFSSADRQLSCPSPVATRTIVFEDNIITAASPPVSAPAAVVGSGCLLSHNLLLPQPSPPASNTVGDPSFVNSATNDFHLTNRSPAIDAAVPSAGLATDHDFDGTVRPQRAAPDVGAYELKP